MLAAVLTASLLGNSLTGKVVVRGGDGVIRACDKVMKKMIFNAASSFN